MSRPGEFLAVVGRSGSGKTTLLRLLAGLEAPSEGELLQDGVPITGLNRRARLMFQDARLLPWARVADNVGLGLPSDRAGRVDGPSNVSTSPTGPATGPRRSPEARSSESRWPGPWRRTPACSCSTNHWARSTH